MIKNIILKIGLVCLLVNLLFGLILSMYSSFNIWVSSFVIVINTCLLYSLNTIKLRDGFKIALSFLFIFGALIEFILALVITNQLKDNLCLLGLIILFVIKFILFIISNAISVAIKKY